MCKSVPSMYSLPVCLSFCLSVCLSLSLSSLCTSVVSLTHLLQIYLSTSFSVCLSPPLSPSPSLFLFVCLSVSLFAPSLVYSFSFSLSLPSLRPFTKKKPLFLSPSWSGSLTSPFDIITLFLHLVSNNMINAHCVLIFGLNNSLEHMSYFPWWQVCFCSIFLARSSKIYHYECIGGLRCGYLLSLHQLWAWSVH